MKQIQIIEIHIEKRPYPERKDCRRLNLRILERREGGSHLSLTLQATTLTSLVEAVSFCEELGGPIILLVTFNSLTLCRRPPRASSKHLQEKCPHDTIIAPKARKKTKLWEVPPIRAEAISEIRPLANSGHQTKGVCDSSASDPEIILRTNKQATAQNAFAAIQEYLLDDPDHSLPTKMDLSRLSSELAELICSAVRTLITTALDSQSTQLRAPHSLEKEVVPDLGHALSIKSFFEVCRRAYGVRTVEELYMKVGQSFVCTSDFVRSLLAVAIDEWVFKNGHQDLPDFRNDRKTGISLALEEELARCM